MKILFTTLFLPLGLILIGIGMCAVLAWRGRDRIGGGVGPVVLLSLLVFGWLISTPAVGRGLCALLFSQVSGRELTDPEQVDMVVVLTAGMIDAGPVVGWIPKPQSIQRVSVAYDLQRMINIRLPVVISGGYTKGVKAPSEARVVADFFARHRTEVTPTELEEVSTDTYESVMQLAPVLTKRSIHNVLLVTSDVHMLRALAAFRSRGIDAIPAPALSIPVSNGVRDWLPSVYGLELTSDALYEYYGILMYLISGKINLSDLTYTEKPAEKGEVISISTPVPPR